jgi:plastocyanin
MRTDRLGTKLMVTLTALLLLGAACGKSSDNSGAAGGGTTGSSGSSGGGRYGGGNGGSGSTGGTQSGGTSVMTIQQNNYFFDPATFTVNSGDTITIKNGNANTPHNFTIKGTTIDVTNDALASQDVTIDLNPGPYEFFCTLHVQLGMKGTLTVT